MDLTRQALLFFSLAATACSAAHAQRPEPASSDAQINSQSNSQSKAQSNSQSKAQSNSQSNSQTSVSPSAARTAASQADAARQTATAGASGAAEAQPQVLDSVVAIINGDVLLESDVEQEQRLESLQILPAGENTNVAAAQHLITRTLILQQMKDQQAQPDVADAQVEKVIAEIRNDLPGCVQAHCETSAGWAAFLNARGLTPEEVEQGWKQRLGILDYLNLRFRSGIRIPMAEVEQYYQQTMLPEFKKKHQTPPPVKALADRIREVLVQQQVSKQIDSWESTLREQGSVQILVPAYGPSSDGSDDDMGSGA